MPNRSLYGRARRDSFLQRWLAKSELHTVASHFSTGNFGNFPKPHSRDFSKFLIAFYPVFYWFSCEVVREFSYIPGRFGNFRQ